MNLLKYGDGNIIEIGVDEAGRGPLFGRVYTSAVIWNNEIIIPDNIKINDSKKLKHVDIVNSAKFIMNNALCYSIDYSDENEIDKINILQATMNSMHKSINNIINNINNIKEDNKEFLILVDGTYFNKYKDINHKCIKGGDGKYLSIACASILAKYSRDLYIEELCNENPDLNEKYKINSNKGYGTKAHMDGIKKYGITKYHRKSYKPCCI